MSRYEKKIIKNKKRQKLRLINKILFIICMTLNLAICVYIVDISAKTLLGENIAYENVNIKEIKSTINKNLENINQYIINIIGQINK